MVRVQREVQCAGQIHFFYITTVPERLGCEGTNARNLAVAAPQVLRLFTAAQLEIAVAGEPEFDIEFWKEHTEYKGYRPDDDTVEFFWKV